MPNDLDRKAAEELWDHLLNKTFSRTMAVEHLAQVMVSERLTADRDALERAAGSIKLVFVTEGDPKHDEYRRGFNAGAQAAINSVRAAKEQGNG